MILNVGPRAFKPQALDPAILVLRIRIKYVSVGIFCVAIESKRLNLELLCFPDFVQMVLKDFFLVIFICENFYFFYARLLSFGLND